MIATSAHAALSARTCEVALLMWPQRAGVVHVSMILPSDCCAKVNKSDTCVRMAPRAVARDSLA